MRLNNDKYVDDWPDCCLLYANLYVQFYWGGNYNGEILSVHLMHRRLICGSIWIICAIATRCPDETESR